MYRSTSGTSLSSPITAGLAALVANQFKNYSPLQIGEQIRVNSNNTDIINSDFVNLLGYGRINAHQTLSNTNSKSVRITDIEFVEVGNNNGILADQMVLPIIILKKIKQITALMWLV